jgi:hypothetical protein
VNEIMLSGSLIAMALHFTLLSYFVDGGRKRWQDVVLTALQISACLLFAYC